MNHSRGKRIGALLLAICMMLSMFVPQVEVEANALSLTNLTCSAYISNPTARSYIDVMMKYYINNNSNLQSMLTTGKCVVFMFEGGSDNYWNGETYEKSLYDNRIQAVVFVVKADSSGNAYIDYCSETCSSIASNVLDCTAGVGYSGSTTILDGVYRMYRWNHTGPYASFQLDVGASNANGYGLYTPSSVPNGQLLGCSGINVHTRSTTSGSNWSAGCQLIGTTAYTDNEYNKFFQSVSGLSFNPWVNYYSSPKSLYSYDYYGYGWGSGYTVGYYVVDRQLAMIGTDGVKYGSGSLVNVFNQTALGKLTSYSTPKAEAAGALNFEYSTSQCTYYPSHCQIKCTLEGAPINTQPCSVSTTYNSETLETATLNKTYTATGLYQNHYGNYWYRVTTASGETGYIYGGEVEYVKNITSDITLTSATAPNGLVAGKAFVINGTLSAKYSGLTSVGNYVFSGYTTEGDYTLGAVDSVTNNSYVLAGSNVDDNMWMSDLTVGNYTYVIHAAYKNYYTEGATTLKSNTGTLEMMKEYFAVISSAVDQSSCSHSYATTTLGASNCTESGTKIQSCSKCGKIVTTNISGGSHSYGDWTTTKQPTCTATGTKTRTCSTCKNVETQTIAANGHSYGDWVTTASPSCNTAGVQTKTCSKCGDKQTQALSAVGHSYDVVTHPATCQEYSMNEYTCSVCGDNYKEYTGTWSEWSDVKPADGIPYETKTQYRYSDYGTLTSEDPDLAGYTQVGKTWQSTGSYSNQYVASWPSGFDTSNSIYSKYNNSAVTNRETDTQKVEVTNTGTIGYVFYHWCRGTYTEGPINRGTSATRTDTYTAFHTFVAPLSSVDPTTLTPASDGSVTFAHSAACTDSWWWYYAPITVQDYTIYKAIYTYEDWTDWSEWSDTAVTASDTRKVETRTVYRYLESEPAGHSWVDGICSVCSEICGHSFDPQKGFCTVCGALSPDATYYLVGTINGVTYTEEDIAADPDSAAFDLIRFDGKGVLDITLTEPISGMQLYGYIKDQEGYLVSFAAYDSYTAAGDMTFWLTHTLDGNNTLNLDWHVHEWDAGTVVTAGSCTAPTVKKHTCTGLTVDGHECSWTKVVETPAPGHNYADGVCTVCGWEELSRKYYLFGYINGADYGCEEDYATIGTYLFVNGTLEVEFEKASYVGIKTGDNNTWYMTDGWLGEGPTSATLYDAVNLDEAEKLYIPGKVKVTLTLVENQDGTLTLSYEAEPPEDPTVVLRGATLSFLDEVHYKILFDLNNPDDARVAEMGLLTWTSRIDGTVENAEHVIPGAESYGEFLAVRSQGIAAKNLGDDMYFKVYVQMPDGHYIYSELVSYNARTYATNKINNPSTSQEVKALCVALLNYGAAAQEHFGVATDSYMNDELTMRQQRWVEEYSADLLDDVVAVDANKVGAMTANGGFSHVGPSVNFGGAFGINYIFAPSKTVDGEMKLYVWDAETYENSVALDTSNATQVITMTDSGTGVYQGRVSDIAAKNVDDTVYVCGVYESNGVTYRTGVLAYSLSAYCESMASNSPESQFLAEATAVYCFHVKVYLDKYGIN